MWTLIKRDIWSTKYVWLFILLAITGVAILNAWIIPADGSLGITSLQLPFVLLGIFSYGMTAHICRVEELNRVDQRMLQLPVSTEKIVISRYISSLLLFTILGIYTVIMGVVFPFLFDKTLDFSGSMTPIYILLHAALLIVSIYLPYYFGKSSNPATWAVRLFFTFWLIYMILAIPIFHHQYRNQFSMIPSTIYEAFSQQLFFHSILFLVISVIISIVLYRRKIMAKGTIWIYVCYIFFLLAVLLATPFVSEGRAMNLLEKDMEKIELDFIEAKSVVVDEYDGEKRYQLEIQLSLSVPNELDQSLFHQTKVDVEEYNFHYSSLDYFDRISLDGDRRHYSHTFRTQEILLEEEVNQLEKEFSREDITVKVSHRWLGEEKIAIN